MPHASSYVRQYVDGSTDKAPLHSEYLLACATFVKYFCNCVLSLYCPFWQRALREGLVWGLSSSISMVIWWWLSLVEDGHHGAD